MCECKGGWGCWCVGEWVGGWVGGCGWVLLGG